MRRIGGLALRRRRGRCGYGLGSQGREGGTQRRVGDQDPIIAVAVLARWWDQCCDALEQLQGREDELGAPIGTWLGQVVDQPVGIVPLIGRDTHPGVQRKPAAVLPQLHLHALVLLQYPAPLKSAQDAPPHLCL
jgi:hypothetical protein